MAASDLERAALGALELLLELPQAARRARLAELAGGDTALLARVQRLLEQSERGELDVHAAPEDLEDLIGTLEARESGALGLAQGDLVGPFRLRERLGIGGMGEVWLARREFADFEQTVAVKVLRRGLESPDLVRRFRHERRLLADLNHVAIPRLVDGGATADGRPFLAMEYIDGVPIDVWVRRRGLGLHALSRLFIEVCAGVEHAHQRGIVHRDLKPSNVLVDAEGRPKVLDFGIAKVLDEVDAAESALVTRTGQRVLTPRYASPEQIAGGPLTRAVDIHSLGVLLYELLTGAPPYGDARSTPAELEEAILHEEPLPPSRSLTGARAAERGRVEGDIDNICLMALRKDPLRRYASAGRLAEDLERHLAGLPVAARPDTWRYQLGRYVRRNRVLVGGVAATTVTLVAGIVVSRMQYIDARDAAEVSARTAYVATIDAVESGVRSGEVRGMKERLDAVPERLRGWEWRHLARRIDRSLGRIEFRHETARSRAAVVWGDSGRWIAVADNNDIVISDGERERSRHGFFSLPLALAEVPGEDAIVVADPSGALWWGTIDADLDVRFAPLGSIAADDLATHVLDLAVCPRGVKVAATLSSGEVLLLAARTGEHLARFALHEPSRSCGQVAWSPDGHLVATAGWDETVQLIDAERLVHNGGWRAHTMGVSDLAFDTTGERLATCSLDRMLSVWDVATRSALVQRRHAWTQTAVRFVDAERLLVADNSGAIRIVDALTGNERSKMLGHPVSVVDVDFDPSGERFAAVDVLSGARLWRTDTLDVPTTRVCEFAYGLALSPDGREAVTGAPDERVRVWALPGLDADEDLPWRAGYVHSVDWSADGRWIASAHQDGGFALWRAEDHTLARRITVPPGEQVAEVRVTPDGARLYGVTFDPERRSITLTGWDAATGAPLPGARWELPALSVERTRLLLKADGAPRAMIVSAYSLWVFDRAGEPREVSLPEPAWAHISFTAGHDEGTLIVSTGLALHTFDTESWHWTSRVQLSVESHIDLAVHPDGSRIAVTTGATIELLDTANGQRMATLNGHGAEVSRLLWTRDGTTLVSMGYEGDLKVWESR